MSRSREPSCGGSLSYEVRRRNGKIVVGEGQTSGASTDVAREIDGELRRFASGI